MGKKTKGGKGRRGRGKERGWKKKGRGNGRGSEGRDGFIPVHEFLTITTQW